MYSNKLEEKKKKCLQNRQERKKLKGKEKPLEWDLNGASVPDTVVSGDRWEEIVGEEKKVRR